MRRRHVGATASHEHSAVLDVIADVEDEPAAEQLALAFRREVFVWAARQIQSEFAADTWNVFWASAVEGQTINEVARRFRKSVGAVYAARSRVMRRLKEKVREFEEL